jgi:hypothetical protein
MPTTTTIIIPLELSPQVQQSTEVINSPCAMLDTQGNDIGHHLRSSTPSVSKEGKKVDVTDITTRDLNTSLRCNLSLPTSDTLAKLPPHLKPPLLESPIPTMSTAPVVPPSAEQKAAVLAVVHQNDNSNVKPPGTLKGQQSLKEGKVSGVILRKCRHHQCRYYHPRAQCGRQHHCRYHYRYHRLRHCTGAPHLCKTSSSWRNASRSIIEADTPALVIPTAKWNDNTYSVTCQVQPLKEGNVSVIILRTCRCHRGANASVARSVIARRQLCYTSAALST